MIAVTVLWPSADDATFDYDYYLGQHVPMVEGLLGSALTKVEVARGVGGLGPGAPPSFTTITSYYFDSVEAFQAAFGPHVEQITGDERNFTNIATAVQISEIVK